MNFFRQDCQSGPHTDLRFGLCDDQNTTKAYVDTVDPAKWIATVENSNQEQVTFTAIDKCVIQDNEELGRERCDGMLTTSNLLYLVELKDQKPPWRTHAIEQLRSTIEFLKANHDLAQYRHKKAFACNKKYRPFVEIDNEMQLAFFRSHGFRIDIQATILILS